MTTHTPTGQMLTFRNDRLGGRLISLVNAMRIARSYDLPYSVRWHHAEDIARVFNDPLEFFTPDFVEAKFIDQATWNPMRHSVIRYTQLDGGVDALRAALDQGRNVLFDNSFGLVVLDGEDPDSVARETAQVWADFPFSDTLKTAFKDVTKALGKKAMGYHIRRGDIISVRRVMNRAWPNKYVYDEVYFAHIERSIAKGATPVLFSDDADTIERFTKAYPALKAAETLFDPTAFTEGQRDALELLTMSKCKQIIAPESSGFSSTAATLGGVKHIDVSADLTKAEAKAAGERLLKRVKVVRKRPLELRETGHLSQSLEHMSDYLRSEDRLPEAAHILDRHIKGGLNISFLYPKLIEMFLELGEVKKARAIGHIMMEREVHFLPDFALGNMLTGLADLALGDTASMADRTLNAFWNAAAAPFINGITGGLIDAGHLTDQTFLPSSQAALSVWRKHPLRLAKNPALVEIIGCDTAEERFLLPNTDPITWDWMPLMRQVSPHGLGNHKHRPNYERGLARLTKSDPSPDAQSMAALFDMYLGEEATWLTRLQQLATAAPDDAMVQHRASLAAWNAEDYATAARFAETAVAAAPRTPAHRLWRGIVAIKTKSFETALTDLQHTADQGFNLPRLHIRIANVAGKLGRDDMQEAALDRGVEISPRDGVSRLTRAEYHHARGDVARVMEDLDIVMRFDQVPPRAQNLWDKCQTQSGSNAA